MTINTKKVTPHRYVILSKAKDLLNVACAYVWGSFAQKDALRMTYLGRYKKFYD